MLRPILRAILALVAAFGLFAGCDKITSSSKSEGATGNPGRTDSIKGGTGDTVRTDSISVAGVWIRVSGGSTETVTLLPGGVASLDSVTMEGATIKAIRYEGTWTGTGNTGSITWTSFSTSTDLVTWTEKKPMSDGSYTIEVNGSVGVATVHGVKREYTKGTVAVTPVPVTEVVPPTISVPTGTYTTTQTVSIVTATVGGTIRYTTDGTTPTTSSSLYSSALAVASTKTIKAITVLGSQTSSVASVTITIDGGSKPDTKAASLVGSWVSYDATTQTYHTLDFSTDGEVARSIQSTKGFEVHQGTFSTSAGTLTMTWENALKGTDPAALSPIAIPAPTVATFSVAAGKLSLASGGKTTVFSSDSHVIEDPVVVPLDAPVISPAGGTFTSSKSVTISAEPGATIYFTVNGSTPTLSSNRYSGAISIASTQTIKAIAVLDGQQSPVSSATITINTVTVPNSSLVGSWRPDEAENDGGMIFDASGTGAILIKDVSEGDVIYVKLEGSYTISGKSLSLELTRQYESEDGVDWGSATSLGVYSTTMNGTFSISGRTLTITSIESDGSTSVDTFTKVDSIF